MGVKLGELEVLDLVATGGMAEVYRARLGGKMLAIKRILPQFTKEKDLVQMFVDEAKVASTLRHPAVVRVFDLALTEGGDFYILMEFADGRDLSDVLYAAGLKNTRFTPAVATYAARQVLSALHYAHNAVGKDGRPMGLIHRDISPHNVMAGYDGWVKLTDFGIAKVQHSGHQTMAGVVKGKFGYMSPEQARGKKLDGRSDLYNVGILLYEMVSGERLFAGSSDISTLDRMRAAEVPPLPRALGCPPELEAVIRRALQKSADDRFPDAAGFDAALADVEARCGLRNGAQELSKLVNQLYGSSRVPAPERPSKPPVAIRSATAQRPEESELLNPSAPPPAGAGAQRAASVARMAAAPAAPSAVRSSLPAMADPNAPPRTVSGSRLPPVSVGGGIRTTLPQIPAARVPSQTRLPPVPAAPVLPPMATDAPGADEDFSEENTRFEQAAVVAAASQVVMGGRKTTGAATPAVSAITTKASLQALPAAGVSVRARALDAPPSTLQDNAPATPPMPAQGALRIGGGGLKPLGAASQSLTNMPAAAPSPAPAPPPAAPASRVIQTSSRLAPIKDPPSNPSNKPRKAVVWQEPSLIEESARMDAPIGFRGPAAAPPPPARARPSLPQMPTAPPSAETSMFAPQLDLDGPPADPPPAQEDDGERRKREALDRIKAKKAAKAAGKPFAEFAADDAPPPPTEENEAPADEDEKARKKREALERIKAKKAAKAAAAADTDGDAQGPPADEDEKARKKREALERIKAKKAARAAAAEDGGSAEGAEAAEAGGAPEPPGELGEWRTRPDAPPSAPQPERAGKVLEEPLETYSADVRPLARRGAWVVGEPGISPVDQSAGARRRDLARKVLPSGTRRRALLLAVTAGLAGYLVATRRASDLARVLGPAAPYLMANAGAAGAPPKGTVALTVVSGPPGAKVVVDGESLPGQTPLTASLLMQPGDHKVMLVRGKQRKEVAFSVAKDAAAAWVDVSLADEGAVDVRLEHVDGAQVWLDGQRVPDPKALKALGRDRTHHLEVRVGDRQVAETLLTPERPQKTLVAPLVPEANGVDVVVVAQPPATVWMGNQQLAAVTGLTPLRVPAGRQTLTLKVPGSALSRELVVDANNRAMRRYYVEMLQ